jgi:hypothetical protein
MKKEVVSLLAVLIILPAIIFAVLVLDGTTTYSSTDTNVTQESGFAHLNISDGNLILYLTFDYNSSSGIVYDYTNNSNNGTKTNLTSNYSVAGKYGGAYYSPGENNRAIHIADSSSLRFADSSFTVCFWMNANSLDSTGNIIGTENAISISKGWKFSVANGNRVYFYLANDSGSTYYYYLQTGGTLTTNQWYHICSTFNATEGNVSIYLNSNVENSETSTMTPDFEKNYGLDIGNVEDTANKA